MSIVKAKMGEQVAGPELPKKLFYRINEVSRLTGLEPYVLRYWESMFDELSPEKDSNKQRRYRAQDLELIFRIKKLLYEDKYTIAGAKEILRVEKSVATARADPTEDLIKKSNQVLKALNKLRRDLILILNQLKKK